MPLNLSQTHTLSLPPFCHFAIQTSIIWRRNHPPSSPWAPHLLSALQAATSGPAEVPLSSTSLTCGLKPPLSSSLPREQSERWGSPRPSCLSRPRRPACCPVFPVPLMPGCLLAPGSHACCSTPFLVQSVSSGSSLRCSRYFCCKDAHHSINYKGKIRNNHDGQ